MTISNSDLAYEDCYDLFEKAVASEKGVRAEFVDPGSARHFVMRLHQARQLKRDLNSKVYDKDHPMFGKSEYDGFKCSHREVDEIWYVYVEKVVNLENVEEL